MRHSSHKLIHSFHHHIDNGGITFEVYDTEPEDEGTFDWMTLSESFFGYATSSITVHNQGSEFLRKLGQACLEAAAKLDSYNNEKASTAGERYAEQQRKKEQSQLEALAQKHGYELKRSIEK